MMKLSTEIEKANSIVLLGHVKPDGDCIGSVTALYQYIRNMYPQLKVEMVLDSYGGNFHYIPVMEEIREVPSQKCYDLAISLDCATLSRLGKFQPIFQNAAHTIVIDHHAFGEEYGELRYVLPEKSSTCEVLYDLLEDQYLDTGIATSLYTGLMSDTGVFRYSCTSPETMRIAANLMEYDIPFHKIIEEGYVEKPYKVNRFIARAVLESQVIADGKVIYSMISRKLMQEEGIERTELDGIVEQLRNTAGVEVAIFLYEMHSTMWRVSLRSKNYVNVAEIAQKFGGGGHVRAAGCSLTGKISQQLSDLMREVELRL